MAVNGILLATAIQSRMHNKFRQVIQYQGPLAQQNPSYFLQFCSAIGRGIVESTPSISFVTVDTGFTGAPPKSGTGIGLGVIIDKGWFTKELYKEIRTQSASTYGSTSHPPWCDDWTVVTQFPDHCANRPNQHNPYNFLTAMCEAISECVTEHYANFRALNSTHPTVYSGAGQIEKGGFFGINPGAVASTIQGLGPSMQGAFWPVLCQAIGKIYTQAIQEHSIGEVVITGVCVPSQSQACGIPFVGIGNGTAT